MYTEVEPSASTRYSIVRVGNFNKKGKILVKVGPILPNFGRKIPNFWGNCKDFHPHGRETLKKFAERV